MRSAIEASQDNFRMSLSSERDDQFRLSLEPTRFREGWESFVYSAFCKDRILSLSDVIRDPIELKEINILLRTYELKTEREWDESNDRIPFEDLIKRKSQLEQKMRYGQIEIKMKPYSHFLDIICWEIFQKLKTLEVELLQVGITVPSSTYEKLQEGASHEAFHFLRYLSFEEYDVHHNFRTRLARHEQLISGDSRLSEWIEYATKMQFLLVNGCLDFSMSCDVPRGFGLEEQIQIFLAPIKPSVGDALLAAVEIIQNGNPDHPLFKEVVEILFDAMDEVSPRDDMTGNEHHQMILSSIRGMDSVWYFDHVLCARLKPLGSVFAEYITKTITKYIPKDFGA